jgi:hypothetical protein
MGRRTTLHRTAIELCDAAVQLGRPRGFGVLVHLGVETLQQRTTAPPLRVINISPAVFELGIEEHRVEGQTVRMYSLARTIADCFRFRNKIGLDVALEALTDAWRSKRLNLDELSRIAKTLRIQRVMQPYLEMVVMWALLDPWQNARNVKLRNAHLAIVDRSKVLDYLLNEAHPDNGGKARFFGLLGYSREDPPWFWPFEILPNTGRSSAVPNQHTARNMLLMGGSGQTQESRQWSIRTVWIIDRGEDAPRLVTAYPGKE